MLNKTKTLLIALACLSAPGLTQAASTWKIGNQLSYYQGDFGTGSTIDIFYDATYVQFRRERLKLKLTVPYESVSGLPEGSVVMGGGGVIHQPGTSRRSSSSTTTHSASGLGDIWLSGRYAVVPLARTHPGIDAYSQVKFGTASYSDGLGTGENDYEFGAGITGYVAPRGYPFADLGYRFVGSPAGLSLRDVLTYDVGYEFAATQRSILTAKFMGQQSEVDGQSAPADLVFAWSYRLSPRGGIELFADKGLSNGSPDFGIGAGAHLNF